MDKISINKKRLKELEDKEYKLECLERGGVDSWEGYDFSLEEYFNKKDKEEKVEEYVQAIGEALVGNIFEPSNHGGGFAISDAGLDAIKEVLLTLINEPKQEVEK